MQKHSSPKHTWKLPSLESRASFTGADAEVVALFQDAGKKAAAIKGSYSGLVDRLRKSEAFVARTGSVQFVRFGGHGDAESVLFVGFGQAEELTEEKARQAAGNVWAKLCVEKSRQAVVDVDSLRGARGIKSGLTHLRLARVFAEGLVLGAYSFEKYKKTQETYHGPESLVFVSRDKGLVQKIAKELEQVSAAAEAVNITRDWSNEPSNEGTPEYFADQAKKYAQAQGLKCTVLTEAEAAREKMGLFLAVGQGSTREGRVVVLEYTPKGVKNPKTICFVGKGVTFDSGGISIKPSLRMEDMKHDMTGAATLFGATLLASKWKVSNRIVTILAFTENMPSGDAIQPGNVVTARNGKTVEIINTDAEGRLVLADVLDYAHQFKPDAIVDAATLTGAVSVALGKHCCAILGNDDALVEELRAAGNANHERIWQLPLFDEYFDDLKSDYADMKNSANDGNGGTIRGAIFLKQFIKPGVKWAHLDIAATAYGLTHLSYYPKKGASGAYVRTLAQFAADF